jgi:hypothetical protein
MRNDNYFFFKNFVLILSTSLVLFSHRAFANDGPPAYIYELTAKQVGQDVIVTPALACSNGCYGAKLTRSKLPSTLEILVSDQIWMSEEKVGRKTTDICSYSGEEQEDYISIEELCSKRGEVCVDCDDNGVNECYPDCESCENYEDEEAYVWLPDCERFPFKESPFSCKDCDEDGVPECEGFCPSAIYYEVLDYCVPPGDYLYKMSAFSGGGGEIKQVEISVVDNSFSDCSFDIDIHEETEDDCDAGAQDDLDEDADNDSKEAEDDYDGGAQDDLDKDADNDSEEETQDRSGSASKIEDGSETHGCQFVATRSKGQLVAVCFLILEFILL